MKNNNSIKINKLSLIMAIGLIAIILLYGIYVISNMNNNLELNAMFIITIDLIVDVFIIKYAKNTQIGLQIALPILVAIFSIYALSILI